MAEVHPRAHEGTCGAALAAARTAQNLSVADVARQLKLSVAQVSALEAGEFERLPGPVFVRGFVRNYARLLKLDPDRVLGSIPTAAVVAEGGEELPPSREIPFPSQRTRRWPTLALLVLLLALAALAGYEFYWKNTTPDTVARSVAPAPAAPAAPLAVDPVPAAPVTPAAPPPMPSTPGEAGVSEFKPSEPRLPTAKEMGPRDASSAGAPAPEAPPAAAPAMAELHFAFERDSWVQVRERASGKTLFTQLNPAGTEQRVSGKPPFMLVIGNAQGVRLTYNDRPVDLAPYTVRDDVARFTLE